MYSVRIPDVALAYLSSFGMGSLYFAIPPSATRTVDDDKEMDLQDWLSMAAMALPVGQDGSTILDS